jgi:hypothetical protein
MLSDHVVSYAPQALGDCANISTHFAGTEHPGLGLEQGYHILRDLSTAVSPAGLTALMTHGCQSGSDQIHRITQHPAQTHLVFGLKK